METKKNVSVLNLEGDCCGCTACVNVCPVKAITLEENKCGFLNPVVHQNCVFCGKCVDVCQIGKENKGENPLSVYGAGNRDEKIRMQSSSGGIFTLLCDALFSLHGENCICYGAAWDLDLRVVHKGFPANKTDALRGSKYVQSHLGDTFNQIKNHLNNNIYVLFSGTGCQCAGLKRYLEAEKVDVHNLYLIDIVCHGVPSSKLWMDYLRFISKQQGKRVASYKFRNKEDGWYGLNPAAYDSNHQALKKDTMFLSYGKLFGNLALSPRCYSCNFACTKRNGDITLGDFWSVEKTSYDFDNGKGVSVCLLNSQKGVQLMESIKPFILCEKIQDNSFLQPQLCAPTKKNIRYRRFWKDYLKHGYEYVACKYADPSKFHQILRHLYLKIFKRP